MTFTAGSKEPSLIDSNLASFSADLNQDGAELFRQALTLWRGRTLAGLEGERRPGVPEVVQADRWATENKSLKGDSLKAAVDKQAWDDSVKSLAATPSVLAMMSTKLDWTQKLGDAVLAQQPDVMDAVQRLRAKAQANNKLASTKEQKVTVRQEQNRQVIAIDKSCLDGLCKGRPHRGQCDHQQITRPSASPPQ